MVRVRFLLWTAPRQRHSLFRVHRGSTKMAFKITLSTVDSREDHPLRRNSHILVAAYSTDRSKKSIVAFSSVSNFEVRLPTETENETVLNLFVQIRDQRDCVTEYNLSSVVIKPDLVSMIDLINSVLNLPQTLSSNSIAQALASGNQNLVGQLITSLSQQLNRINRQALSNALLSECGCLMNVTQGIFLYLGGLSTVDVSIAPFGSSISLTQNETTLNQSALNEFEQEQNLYASFREYLVQFTTNLTIASPRSTQLQASALAELTESTSQLTRMTSVSIAKGSFTIVDACLGCGCGEMLPTSWQSTWNVRTDIGRRCQKCSWTDSSMSFECVHRKNFLPRRWYYCHRL